MAGHYIGTVENTVNGKPVSGATVEVFTSSAVISGSVDEGFTVSGSYATIYSDDGVTTVNQTTSPVTSDSTGFYEFWTNETSVVLLFSYDGVGRRAISDVEIVGGSINSDVTALSTRVDNHDTLLGYAANAVDLGTFTGTTISDNTDLQAALQELETAVESAADGFDVTASYTVTGQWIFRNGLNTYLYGADAGAATLTDATNKQVRIGSPHYTNAEEPSGVIFVNNLTSSNQLNFGGGTSTFNAATQISFYTAANNTTTTGTERVTIGSDGLLDILFGADITPASTPSTTAVGYLGSPQMSDQDDYTLVMSDAGKHYYHVSATPHTLTIPANASVAFPIGTVIAIVNENGAGDITLAITSDTLRWTDQTGSRTIAANGTASLVKVAATVWRLTGDGIT